MDGSLCACCSRMRYRILVAKNFAKIIGQQHWQQQLAENVSKLPLLEDLRMATVDVFSKSIITTLSETCLKFI